MFAGHLAVGLTGKRIEPRISLGTWILAALLADLLVFPLLIAGIERSKTPPLPRLLNALGIPQVGEATAELLAAEFGSLERLQSATEEELDAVEGVGPNMAHEIRAYFEDRGSQLVAKLLEVGVQPQQVERPAADGPLAGKTVVFTGGLERMSRPEAEGMVRRLGGKAAGSVSARTDYVVAGPGAGAARALATASAAGSNKAAARLRRRLTPAPASAAPCRAASPAPRWPRACPPSSAPLPSRAAPWRGRAR